MKALVFVSGQNITLPKHSAVQSSTKYTHIKGETCVSARKAILRICLNHETKCVRWQRSQQKLIPGLSNMTPYPKIT